MARPIDRIRSFPGAAEAESFLGSDLSWSDFTSFLMEIVGNRVEKRSLSDLLDQHGSDRFTASVATDLRSLHRVEQACLSALPDHVATVVLSPLVPVGAHHRITNISQNRLLATIRRTEVAGDATVGLALEAARRRREMLRSAPRSAVPVELASIQRVTRVQEFAGPRQFAHFSLLGLVSSGRDTGSLGFEVAAMARQITWLSEACLNAGADRIHIALSTFDEGEFLSHFDLTTIEGRRLDITLDEDRTAGRGYYRSGCFKLEAEVGGETWEVGDGGVVDWSAKLLDNQKERMVVSGLGLDRLALAQGQVAG